MKTILMTMFATVVAFSLAAADAQANTSKQPAQTAKAGKVDTAKTKSAESNKGKMSLADAKGKIGDIIKDPSKATDIIKSLSKEDQVSFLAAVNEAIGALPGSNEYKTALYINIDKAMLVGAEKGNLVSLVSEAFATIPAESLVVVQERFAVDLFNRDADSSVSYTDKQFLEIAKTVVEGVAERVATVDATAERIVMAIMMFDRATNSSIGELEEVLMASVPPAQRENAKKWLADAKNSNFDALLESAGVGEAVSVPVTMDLAGPQLLEVVLGACVEGTKIINTSIHVEAQTDESKREELLSPPPTEPGGYQWQK